MKNRLAASARCAGGWGWLREMVLKWEWERAQAFQLCIPQPAWGVGSAELDCFSHKARVEWFRAIMMCSRINFTHLKNQRWMVASFTGEDYEENLPGLDCDLFIICLQPSFIRYPNHYRKDTSSLVTNCTTLNSHH